MKDKNIIIIMLCFIYLCLGKIWYINGTPLSSKTGRNISSEDAAKREKVINIEGRLELYSLDNKQSLTLHTVDGTMYTLKGKLVDKLVSILKNAGEKNFVVLRGKPTGASETSCTIQYRLSKEKKHTPITRCIRYYHFVAEEILKSGTSNITIAPPKRDKQEEVKVTSKYLSTLPSVPSEPSASLEQSVECIKGKITDIKGTSPLTLEIFTVIANKPHFLSVIVTPQTSIIRSNKTEILPRSSLRKGQNVEVFFSENPSGKEALFIKVKE